MYTVTASPAKMIDLPETEMARVFSSKAVSEFLWVLAGWF